jgi:hypothetical protein
VRAAQTADEIPSGRATSASGDVGGGAERTAHFNSVDLAKPGDLALVNRAVVNGWDPSQPVRDAICDQICPAMDAYMAAMKTHPTPNGRLRATKHVVKLVMLALKMDATNRIAEGQPKGWFPYLRKRSPEKRKPRRRRATQAEALERLLEKLERRADRTG